MAKRNNSGRRFGSVRRLPSGRWQASFAAPNGQRRYAPHTFRTKTDADRWLVAVEAEISRGAWLDDKLGRELSGNYARAYLRDNPNIGDRWRETCLRNLRLHVADLEKLPLIGITRPVVRSWYAKALSGPGGNTSVGIASNCWRARRSTTRTRRPRQDGRRSRSRPICCLSSRNT